MKQLAEQTFYTLLGVEFDASPFEINRAYKEMLQLYHEDSLASYSFFTREEREEILAKLHQAHATLIDEGKRSRYNQFLVESHVPEDGEAPRAEKKIPFVAEADLSIPHTILEIRNELKAMVSSNPMIQDILAQEALSGKDLKRIREALGVSLEVIAHMTKIRIIFLCAIEEDAFEKVPSRIFLKSFLRAYAQCIGLEVDIVAGRYLGRIRG